MHHVLKGVGHFDISGPIRARSPIFYSAVLGWRIDKKGPGCSLVETPAGFPDGAIVEAPQPRLTIGIVVEALRD